MAFPQPMTGLAILRYVDPWTIPSGRLPTTQDWSDAAGPKALCEDMNEALFAPKEVRNVPRDVSETRVLSSVFGRFVKPGGESFLGFVSTFVSWSWSLTVAGLQQHHVCQQDLQAHSSRGRRRSQAERLFIR